MFSSWIKVQAKELILIPVEKCLICVSVWWPVFYWYGYTKYLAVTLYSTLHDNQIEISFWGHCLLRRFMYPVKTFKHWHFIFIWKSDTSNSAYSYIWEFIAAHVEQLIVIKHLAKELMWKLEGRTQRKMDQCGSERETMKITPVKIFSIFFNEEIATG